MAINVNLNSILHYTESSTKIRMSFKMSLIMLPDADQKNKDKSLQYYRLTNYPPINIF